MVPPKVTATGRKALAAEEGLVLRPYRDVVGIPTQGVGHTSRAGAPLVTMSNKPWTEEYALEVLGNDLSRTFEPRVAKQMPGAKPHEFDGGVMFDFNTGGIDKASWVDFWRKGNLVVAGERFKQWNKAGGRVISGLVKRRAREWLIIEKGDYGAHGRAEAIKPEPAVLKKGDRDAYEENTILEFQRDLISLGYLAKGGDDGHFGRGTEAAVRAFQGTHPHLTVDGRAGPATRAQVQRALDLRKKSSTVAFIGGSAAGGVGLDAQTQAGVVDWSGLTPGVALTLVVSATAVGFGTYAWKYRGEISQRFNKWSGRNVG